MRPSDHSWRPANLIETLHIQHEEITRIVDRVTDATNRGDVAAVSAGVDALAVALLAHLAIEDAQLYPALTRAAEETRLEVPAKIAVLSDRILSEEATLYPLYVSWVLRR